MNCDYAIATATNARRFTINAVRPVTLNPRAPLVARLATQPLLKRHRNVLHHAQCYKTRQVHRPARDPASLTPRPAFKLDSFHECGHSALRRSKSASRTLATTRPSNIAQACMRSRLALPYSALTRSISDTDLDEVLQTDQVSINVSNGQLASKVDLEKAFGDMSAPDVDKEIPSRRQMARRHGTQEYKGTGAQCFAYYCSIYIARARVRLRITTNKKEKVTDHSEETEATGNGPGLSGPANIKRWCMYMVVYGLQHQGKGAR